MKTTIKPQTIHGLRLDYFMAASYYWFRAEGDNENLVSALNRQLAEKLKPRFSGKDLPTEQEVRQFALNRWPSHKIHGA
jgi:hypothetical protein